MHLDIRAPFQHTERICLRPRRPHSARLSPCVRGDRSACGKQTAGETEPRPRGDLRLCAMRSSAARAPCPRGCFYGADADQPGSNARPARAGISPVSCRLSVLLWCALRTRGDQSMKGGTFVSVVARTPHARRFLIQRVRVKLRRHPRSACAETRRRPDKRTRFGPSPARAGMDPLARCETAATVCPASAGTEDARIRHACLPPQVVFRQNA